MDSQKLKKRKEWLYSQNPYCRTILLCRQCNETLANEETKKIPLKELWKRSGRKKQ